MSWRTRREYVDYALSEGFGSRVRKTGLHDGLDSRRALKDMASGSSSGQAADAWVKYATDLDAREYPVPPGSNP